MSEQADWLDNKAEVQEHTFQSGNPLVGRLREAWAGVAARWLVRAVVQQQNEFNHLVVHRMQDIDARIIAQDHDTTRLRHDLAEVTAQLVQNRRILERIEQRLDALTGGNR